MFFRIFFYSFIALILGLGCTGSNQQFDNFLYGKVRKTISVDGQEREYFVHVPSGYIGSKALPLVFVLHEKGGTGENFYNQSGWYQLAEKENFFAVFPTAKTYCLQGPDQSLNYWNAAPVSEESFCSGSDVKSDIAFFLAIFDKMNIDYNFDKKRVYMIGFGNGGQMTAKAGLAMSDKLAASVQFAGSFVSERTPISNRNVPVLFQVGNKDTEFFGNVSPFSMNDFETSLKEGKKPFGPITETYISTYSLQKNFRLNGDTNTQVNAVYADQNNNDLLEISLVNDQNHSYTTASKPQASARFHWDWLKKYSIP
ncbi:MAG: dienelactone hydrolase family protein [Saprospiraceae bacterium]|nr:dienelactone hydrolase family protein [Saprospiraceae bacterium]MBK8820085.1 dienelactone hydrolase family protein [Saprospiraceae bacterium]